MKINAGHSTELIQLMEVRQRGHGARVHGPVPGFNQMLDLLMCDSAAIDFCASRGWMRSESLI